MRHLPILHLKGEPAVLPNDAKCRQSQYFIYRPHILHIFLVIPDSDRSKIRDEQFLKNYNDFYERAVVWNQ
jgi:hypothetical protein